MTPADFGGSPSPAGRGLYIPHCHAVPLAFFYNNNKNTLQWGRGDGPWKIDMRERAATLTRHARTGGS